MKWLSFGYGAATAGRVSVSAPACYRRLSDETPLVRPVSRHDFSRRLLYLVVISGTNCFSNSFPGGAKFPTYWYWVSILAGRIVECNIYIYQVYILCIFSFGRGPLGHGGSDWLASLA